jgi:hypothetical protein
VRARRLNLPLELARAVLRAPLPGVYWPLTTLRFGTQLKSIVLQQIQKILEYRVV